MDDFRDKLPELRRIMQNAINGMSAEDRLKIHQAIQHGRMQLDADRRKQQKT